MAPKKRVSSKATPAESKSPSSARSTRSSSRGSKPTAKAAQKSAAQAARAGSSTSRPIDEPDQHFFADAYQAVQNLETGALDEFNRFDRQQVADAFILLQDWLHLDGNARASDDPETRKARPLYRQVKKLTRFYFNENFNTLLTVHPEDMPEPYLCRLAQDYYDDNALHPARGDLGIPVSARMRSFAPSRQPSQSPAPAPARGSFARTPSMSPAKARVPSSTLSPTKTAAGRIVKPTSRSRTVSPSKVPARSSAMSPSRQSRGVSQGPSDGYRMPRVPSAVTNLNVGWTRTRSPAKPAIQETSDVSMSDESVLSEDTMVPQYPLQEIPDEDDFIYPSRQTSFGNMGRRAPTLTETLPPLDGGSEERPRFVPVTIATPQCFSLQEPSAPRRGLVVSHTNPKEIVVLGKKKPNPFFETMPAPEVWHRRMPRYFPFGETPRMEALMSQQIDEDLKRGLEDMKARRQSNATVLQKIASVASGVREYLTSPKKPAAERRKVYPSAWDLPTVSDQEVEEARKHPASPGNASARASSPKRRQHAQMSGDLGETH